MFQGGAVLQMNKTVPVWGFAASAGVEIQLLLDGAVVATSRASSQGNFSWIAYLPPQPPTYRRQLAVQLVGEDTKITEVVHFGQVVLCSGQSNMGMTVGFGAPHTAPFGSNRSSFSADNGTAETAAAGRYEGKIFIRNDNGPYSPPVTEWNSPRLHAKTPDQWTDVNNETLGDFSAVCWYAGKSLFERTLAVKGVPTPLGLIEAAVGGSPIEYWIPPIDPTDPDTNPCELDRPQCDSQKNDSQFFHEYIEELLPYSVTAVIWDQAERDVKCPKALAAYPCLQKYLISSWKKRFNSTFAFVAVQLAGYTAPLINGTGEFGAITSDMVYTMRLQQEAGCEGISRCAVVPTYDKSCSAGVDGGCPYGAVHQPDKPEIGARVGAQLFDLIVPGSSAVVQGPRVQHVTVTADPVMQWIVSVAFSGGSSPYRFGPTRNCTTCCDGSLSNNHTLDFDVLITNGTGSSWVNGTHALLQDADTSTPKVTFRVPQAGQAIAVRFTAAAIFPQCTLFSAEGLPAFPFTFTIPSASTLPTHRAST